MAMSETARAYHAANAAAKAARKVTVAPAPRVSRHRSTARSLGTCWECHSRRAVTTAPDSSGIVGAVCGRCDSMSQYERSYC